MTDKADWPDGVTHSLAPDDVIWEMDWSPTEEDGTPHYPDKPEKEEMFEEEAALAMLLINEQVFLNSHWMKKDWPGDAKKTFSINANCNDVFAWGCSDAEEVLPDELESLYRLYMEHPRWGTALWCMTKRREMPQRLVAEDMIRNGVDLEAFKAEHNLRDNHYDGVSRVFALRKYTAYAMWETERGNEPRPYDKHWWGGWREFVAANPDWRTEEWIAADHAERKLWRKEHGHDE